MRTRLILCLIVLSQLARAQALPDVQSGPAAVMQPRQEISAALLPQPSAVVTAAGSVSVDPYNRYQVSVLYRTTYLAGDNAVNGWSGSVAPTCNAGSTSQAFQDATIERVNVYRALAGLPGNITEFGGATEQTDDQDATLMMVANQSLSHSPPSDWNCYTAAGDAGAGHSNLNLAYASYSNFTANGPAAVDGYMQDDGNGTTANNSVGHRRWLLFPPQANMASGDVGPVNISGYYYESNALWVFGDPNNPGNPFGSRPSTPNGIAWPPRGYVPWQLLPGVSNRWSLSLEYANFDSASVSMTRNGVALSTPMLNPTQNNGQGINGAGFQGDNTLVWEPTGVTYTQPTADVTYHVTVSGITGNGGNVVPSSVSYDVIVINPNDAVFADGFE